MYGLVNRALADLLRKKGGPELWERVRREAGVGVDVFVSLERYPDSTTVALLVAGAQALSVTPPDLLEEFGKHWVGYAAEHGYRQLMQARGKSLFGFISKLDELHSRLFLSFPELCPPSFTTQTLTDDTIRLTYTSTRDGLAPFVVGLLHGLATLFDCTVSVTHDVRKQDGAGRDEFLVQMLSRGR
jgi:hypothetical protein